MLQEIAVWEIVANDNLGSWTSSSTNPNRLWPIKTVVDSEPKANDGRSRIKLCFPDNQDSKISAFTLRALDFSGTVLFQQTVRK